MGFGENGATIAHVTAPAALTCRANWARFTARLSVAERLERVPVEAVDKGGEVPAVLASDGWGGSSVRRSFHPCWSSRGTRAECTVDVLDD